MLKPANILWICFINYLKYYPSINNLDVCQWSFSADHLRSTVSAAPSVYGVFYSFIIHKIKEHFKKVWLHRPRWALQLALLFWNPSLIGGLWDVYALDRLSFLLNQKCGRLRDLIYSDLYEGHSFSAVPAHNSSISLGTLESITLGVSPPWATFCLSSNQARHGRWLKLSTFAAYELESHNKGC